MEDCTLLIDSNTYEAPTLPCELWSSQKLAEILQFVHKKLSAATLPTVIIIETGHFMLPAEETNLTWAHQNMTFANALCGEIIKKQKHRFKIIPTLLVNNLDADGAHAIDEIIEAMLKDQKYITQKSLKVISERNLKNRAFKALKTNPKLTDSFIHIDGKAYLKEDEYKHDLAAGFVNEDGHIIPRCGLILTSYLDLVSQLAKQRLHQNSEIGVLFISFSQHFHEYKRVMLGVDIYNKSHDDITLDPMIIHWSYPQNQCLVSLKPCHQNGWEDLKL